MSKLGNALLEATQDDMAIGTELSDDARLVQNIIDAAAIVDQNATEADYLLGWTLFDLDKSITTLDTMRADLSPFKKELGQLAQNLTDLAKSLE